VASREGSEFASQTVTATAGIRHYSQRQSPVTKNMSETTESLLAHAPGQAAGRGSVLPIGKPAVQSGSDAPSKADDKLDALLSRIRAASQAAAPDPQRPAKAAAADQAHKGRASTPVPISTATTDASRATGTAALPFLPVEPASLAEARVSTSEVEGLMLKMLLSRGDATGRNMSDHIKLPFLLLENLLRQMKTEQVVVHKGSAPMNDYLYQLTDVGRERARRLAQSCTYFGSAPVTLKDYINSVKAQSLTNQHPTVDQLQQAFSDLLVNPKMLRRLGPAVNSGRGLFLYGAAGNGKTSIAERVTRAFGQYIWVPRAIGIDGEIIRVFDPSNHEEAPLESSTGLLDSGKVDKRWVRIKRPTIVVGGELTMDNLEITLNPVTGISEAPVQLKSNCGTLVIDDFGRQRMSTSELLNRWIIPLEKRYDFLNLASGKKLEVPFDQLIIFSTNLQPKDLCDDAFLRRIPYKIEVIDPSEEEFRQLFRIIAPKMGFTCSEDALDHLIDKHYRAVKRPYRNCQPRDLLLQVRNLCYYEGRQPEMTCESMDFAVENYFAIM